MWSADEALPWGLRFCNARAHRSRRRTLPAREERHRFRQHPLAVPPGSRHTHARLAPEPGALALREAPRRDARVAASAASRSQAPVDVRAHLAIADAAPRPARIGESARAAGAGPRRRIRRATIGARAPRCARRAPACDREPDEQGVVRRLGEAVRRLPVRQPSPARERDLERAHDAHRVVRVDARRRGGSSDGEMAVQRVGHRAVRRAHAAPRAPPAPAAAPDRGRAGGRAARDRSRPPRARAGRARARRRARRRRRHGSGRRRSSRRDRPGRGNGARTRAALAASASRCRCRCRGRSAASRPRRSPRRGPPPARARASSCRCRRADQAHDARRAHRPNSASSRARDSSTATGRPCGQCAFTSTPSIASSSARTCSGPSRCPTRTAL